MVYHEKADSYVVDKYIIKYDEKNFNFALYRKIGSEEFINLMLEEGLNRLSSIKSELFVLGHRGGQTIKVEKIDDYSTIELALNELLLLLKEGRKDAK